MVLYACFLFHISIKKGENIVNLALNARKHRKSDESRYVVNLIVWETNSMANEVKIESYNDKVNNFSPLKTKSLKDSDYTSISIGS